MIRRAFLTCLLALPSTPLPAQETPTPPDVARYCAAVAQAAADSETAQQIARLEQVDKEIKARIALLDEKRADFESWVRRREDMLRKAEEGVVAIYSKMRPDAAAAQLAVMEEEAAAAVLAKLNARAASTILAEMEAARAARLAEGMALVQRGRKDAS